MARADFILKNMLFLGVALMMSGCSPSSFVYRAPPRIYVDASFADANANVLLRINPEFSGASDRLIERRTPAGELIDRVVDPGGMTFRLTRGNQYLTVDGGRLLLLRTGSDPTNYEVVLGEGPPGPIAQAVMEWLALAGGVSEDSWLTNPYNNHSCAMGADRSLAIWNFMEPGSFWATEPGALDDEFSPWDFFCLEAEGVSAIAVTGVGPSTLPPGQMHSGRLRIFEQDARYEVGNLAGLEPGLLFSVDDSLVATYRDDNTPTTIHAARAVKRDGEWLIERASAGVMPVAPWPPTAKVDENEIWIAGGGVVQRWLWPIGSARVMRVDPVRTCTGLPFLSGNSERALMFASAGGRWLLWDDIEALTIRVERICIEEHAE